MHLTDHDIYACACTMKHELIHTVTCKKSAYTCIGNALHIVHETHVLILIIMNCHLACLIKCLVSVGNEWIYPSKQCCMLFFVNTLCVCAYWLPYVATVHKPL